MQDILTLVGKKLRHLREEKNLTIAQVATRLQKSSSQIGSVERADRVPSLSSLIELATFYEIPLAYLFEDDLCFYQQQVGNFLTSQMIAKGVDLASLAKRANINYFSLAEFFQGRGHLEIQELKQIAIILNLTTEQIMPEIVKYISLIRYYLKALGLDQASIQNVVDYVYSKFKE